MTPFQWNLSLSLPPLPKSPVPVPASEQWLYLMAA